MQQVYDRLKQTVRVTFPSLRVDHIDFQVHKMYAFLFQLHLQTCAIRWGDKSYFADNCEKCFLRFGWHL